MTSLSVAPLRGAEVHVPSEVSDADVLERAADLLEEFGWCQGLRAMTLDGFYCEPHQRGAARFCLVGAVQRARFDFGDPFLDGVAAYKWADQTLGDTRTDCWNDNLKRTKGEVVARLRDAAARARGES